MSNKIHDAIEKIDSTTKKKEQIFISQAQKEKLKEAADHNPDPVSLGNLGTSLTTRGLARKVSEEDEKPVKYTLTEKGKEYVQNTLRYPVQGEKENSETEEICSSVQTVQADNSDDVSLTAKKNPKECKWWKCPKEASGYKKYCKDHDIINSKIRKCVDNRKYVRRKAGKDTEQDISVNAGHVISEAMKKWPGAPIPKIVRLGGSELVKRINTKKAAQEETPEPEKKEEDEQEIQEDSNGGLYLENFLCFLIDKSSEYPKLREMDMGTLRELYEVFKEYCSPQSRN